MYAKYSPTMTNILALLIIEKIGTFSLKVKEANLQLSHVENVKHFDMICQL